MDEWLCQYSRAELPDGEVLYFKCMAENEDHAREQLLNAEPEALNLFCEVNARGWQTWLVSASGPTSHIYLEVKVHGDSRDGYYATHPDLGCGKTRLTELAAVRALLVDHRYIILDWKIKQPVGAG